MLPSMRSRVVAAVLGALALTSFVACSSDGGTGAPPGTTVKLGAASFVTLPPVVTSTTVAPAAGGDGATVVPGEQQYTVESGDVLVNIAKKFCIKYTDIVAYNGWSKAQQLLYPGLVIKIPPNACQPGSAPPESTQAASETTVASTPAETTTTFDQSAGGTYTVVSGDTLSGIAAKVGTTVDAIVAANNWSDGANHLIYAGLKTKLPAKSGRLSLAG